MSTIISFFGGPGVGKSTAAALVYADLKTRGKSVELVREAAKEYCWEGRKIEAYSQFLLTAEQVHREALLYGKVDYIVTDSPPPLGIIYASKYYSYDVKESIRHMVEGMRREAEIGGQVFTDVLLRRLKGKYETAGRWEDEANAKEIDAWLDEEVWFQYECTSSADDLKALVDGLVGVKP